MFKDKGATMEPMFDHDARQTVSRVIAMLTAMIRSVEAREDRT
ncbi:MAG TPA: hypothetical protein VHG09_02170 [Longimicrobiales bacterium]|nr:hypothetical protein [Longimicrobiales bacterium]